MRLAITLAGLAGFSGAAGVILAAVAAHRINDASLATAAHFLIMHAGAVLAVVALSRRCTRPLAWLVAAAVLLAGSALFSGDIALRAFTGARLFPMAAPTGGTLQILGWIMIAVAAALEWRDAR